MPPTRSALQTRSSGRIRRIFGALLLVALGANPALALIFYDTGDPAHNRESAPTGAWAGSGWRYQGLFRSFLGTMISPRHFVTAAHISPDGNTFAHKAFFSGSGASTFYLVNPNVNGGVGYWTIPDSDLRVFEIYGEFPYYAPLYTGSDEAGKDLVAIGRGRPRGAEVRRLGQLRGWQWGANDERVRWGTNRVDSILADADSGDFLVFDFDAAAGTHECQAAVGDSGGAIFVQEGATWKLAGILSAVDSQYDTNTVCGDGLEFNAALFDASGYFIGGDDPCEWELVAASADNEQSRGFATRISSKLTELEAIIEPAIAEAALSPSERYAQWLVDSGVPGSPDLSADTDGDRQPDLVEYFAALDPTGGDSGIQAFTVEVMESTLELIVRMRLDADVRGLSYEIQEAAAITGPWVALSGLAPPVVSQLRGEGVETRRYQLARPDVRRRFYRLAVTVAP